MNNRDSNTLLPKGLAGVGPGLGQYGKTLPDIVEQFERFVRGENSSIDASLFYRNLNKSNEPAVPLRSYMPPPQTPRPHTQMIKGSDAVTVQFSGLPPSTNFVNFGQNLSEFGNVEFLEFTTPGCAVVRFASSADADRCLQNFTNIQG